MTTLPGNQPREAENRGLGLTSAVAVIFIWSGFIVFSRMGVGTALTPHDITALRLAVAGALTLPFVGRWWPRHISFRAAALLALCGPGAVYAAIMYSGLQQASAAFGGVFANGSLPIFTMALVAIYHRQLPARGQIAGVLIIVAGAVLLAVSDPGGHVGNPLRGMTLFLLASAILSIYLFGLRRWNITPRQALALVNIPNAVLYLPVWYFALPSGLDQAAPGTILFQALFQGLGPGFLAVILFALATAHLGPTLTAGFSAVVPASAALLAIPLLGETPSPTAWAGICLATLGLALMVRRSR